MNDLTPEEQKIATEAVNRYRREQTAEYMRSLRRDKVVNKALTSMQLHDSLTIYGAQRHSDLDEGRGRIYVAAWFLDPDEALKLNVKLPGVMGYPNDLNVRSETVYLIHEDYEEKG